MSTTTDKVKELGITKGTNIRWEPCYGMPNGEYNWALVSDESIADGMVLNCYSVLLMTGDCTTSDGRQIGDHPDLQLYADAHNTAQKSGCLPSELLEQRDEAMKLASDAVDLIKVLANQIHSLPQNAVSALTHRTFSEMFDLRDGAAYGQAKAIVDRLTRIKQA